MLKRLFASTRYLIPAGVVVILGIWISWVSWDGFLNAQTARDKNLARMTYENMQRMPQSKDNLVSFKCSGPGEYICETTGLNDSHSAGRFGYNSMVVLIERNGVVMTGRALFKIHGYQNGEPIFEVTYNLDGLPEVKLKGPFEGEEFEPTFGSAMIVPVDSDYPGVRAHT